MPRQARQHRGRFCVFWERPGAENEVIRVTDEQASVLMQKIAKCENATAFQKLDPIKRDKYLKKLREAGVSIRQLSRLTGISVGIVRKVG